jgi:AraC family transcriptional regulator, regulatory protein of adaptative response / methylated-DNA-[protein]-cysteine methyltransferase
MQKKPLSLHRPIAIKLVESEEPPALIEWGCTETTLGTLWVGFSEYRLAFLEFIDTPEIKGELDRWQKKWPKTRFIANPALAASLGDRLQDSARGFWPQLTLFLVGTEFQRNVWRALLKIPAGHVVTYADLAASIQKPAAVRAVGLAVGSNPISILIPCHRVIGSDGQLRGYRWGLDRRRTLLTMEEQMPSPMSLAQHIGIVV